MAASDVDAAASEHIQQVAATEELKETSTAIPAPSAGKDHPEGDAIRKQVEFYFSDENLPTDAHLLQYCGGRENLPVSISRITGFKKMRVYKPKSLVVAALRKSTFLEVSTDGKTIKRKTPFQGKCLLDPDFLDDPEIAYDLRTRKAAEQVVVVQQKKEIPPGMTKGMMKPTGFEDAYTEPLLTPAEAEEEDRMYDEDKHFIERIEIAIQRFKQRRRMHAMYAHVFDKLMRFGGVESSQRTNQGLSQADMKEMDAEDIARALATHTVPWDRDEKDKWVVDFRGVGAAFLNISSWYPAYYGYGPGVVKQACQVLRSFYNYLRYHKVCPEYDDQLAAVLAMCNTAEKELCRVQSAGIALPGDFNRSASVLCGGSQADLFTGDKSWAQEFEQEGVEIERIGIRTEEASVKFHTGVAAMGTDEQNDIIESGITVAQDESIGLEVTAILLPNDATREFYAEHSQHVKNKLGSLEPLGTLVCKSWYAPSYDEWDLPKDKYPDGKPQSADEGKEYQFWIEESVLDECFLGMKIDARVLTLTGGMTILDEIRETMCSFFTWLPNELWMDRKPKKFRWLPKGLAVDEEEEEEQAKLNGEGRDMDHEQSDDE